MALPGDDRVRENAHATYANVMTAAGARTSLIRTAS